MLTFGTFALADYNTYGVGVMEVGTFYALCKIYLSPLAKKELRKLTKEQDNETWIRRIHRKEVREVCWSKHFESIHGPVVSRSVPYQGVGKYISRLSKVFVGMQQDCSSHWSCDTFTVIFGHLWSS